MTASATRPAGSLRAAWRLLRERPDRLLVPAAALAVLGLSVNVLLQWLIGSTIAGSTSCTKTYLTGTLTARCAASDGRAQLGVLLGLFLVFLIGHLVAAGMSRAALDVVDDRPARGVLGGWSLPAVLPAAAVTSLLLTVGTVFLLLPGLVLMFLTRYTMTFVVDRGLGPLPALRASVDLVLGRFASELGFTVRAFGVLVLGLLLLGVGLVVAVPLVLLAQTLRYRASGAGAVGVEPEDRPVQQR